MTLAEQLILDGKKVQVVAAQLPDQADGPGQVVLNLKMSIEKNIYNTGPSKFN